ncbi:MAG: DUF4265 domain-containing protein [Fimbriimonadaceae bacterium]|nr:DUF4265 domain-containing protein [Fimbriimonadaceae bacterium]
MAAIYTHQEPIWRDRSDFVIAAKVDEASYEQLFAKRIEAHTFMICCIPFFVYDLNLGDIVETDDAYFIQRRIENSGRYVFRVMFQSDNSLNRIPIAERLLEIGCLLEQSSENFFAVDAVNQECAQNASNFLFEMEGKGILEYETGAI